MIVDCLSPEIPVGASVSSVQWQGFRSRPSPWKFDLMALIKLYPSDHPGIGSKSTLTSIDDPWSPHGVIGGGAYPFESRRRLLISDLGCTPEKAAEIYMRLRHFEEDWNAPGMDAYDDL